MSMLVHGDKPEAKKSNKYVEIKKVNTKYFVLFLLFRILQVSNFQKVFFYHFIKEIKEILHEGTAV